MVVADEPDARRDVENEAEEWPGEDAAEAEEGKEASGKKEKNGKKRRKIIIIGAAVLLFVAIAGSLSTTDTHTGICCKRAKTDNAATLPAGTETT